jgi:hypothetical protein
MMRRKGDAQGESFLAAFRDGFQKLGWNDGGNASLDVRWGTARPSASVLLRSNWSA